jgi:Dolichyl-phosphate-mannose-protein mannosyltransferase
MPHLAKRIHFFFGAEVNRVITITLIGLGLRSVQLGADLWEKHSWRQADIAMISSNFYRNGFDILHPQVNWAGNMPGFVGTEFPLVPFLTALLYLIFGEHLILGRLVSIGFFILSIPLFYLLVRKYFGQQTAWLALFFYVASPLSVFYTRNLMPESAMLCFAIGALYFFSSWMDDDKNSNFLLAILFTALALLVKIPMGVTGVPLGYLAFTKHKWSMFRQKKLWIFGFAVITPSVVWYQHAFSLAANNYPFHMFGERLWIWDGGGEAFFHLRVYLKVIMNTTMLLLTPLGLLMAVGGVIVASRKQPASYLFHWWALGLLVYLIVGLDGHYRHEYYQLPFVPVAATFAGVFGTYLMGLLDKKTPAYYKRIAAGALVVLILVPCFELLSLKYYSQPEQLLYHAGRSVDARIEKNALIVAWDGDNPLLIYASNRHGWHFEPSKDLQETIAYVEELRTKGAGYFVAPLAPISYQDAAPRFIRGLEATVRRRVLGLSETHSAEYVGALRLFEPGSDFASYLAKRYRKIFEDEFVAIYDLRSKGAD